MIIYSVNDMKIYETRSDAPSRDFTNGRAEYVIDETNKENSEIISKIKCFAPFFTIVTDNSNNIISIEDDPGSRKSFELSKINIDELRASKLTEISEGYNSAIISGVDIKTSQGIEHFTLEENDQINLNAALQAIQQGATAYPYHSYKQLCRMFSADEIIKIVVACTNYKIYHTTLHNHLSVWIDRAETKEELDLITYSAENLPKDLAANMQSILSVAIGSEANN